MSTPAGEHVTEQALGQGPSPATRWVRSSTAPAPARSDAVEDLHRLDDWVELNDLACPGCAEPVTDEPPTTRQPGEPPLTWSHRDGSPLCGQQPGGGQAEPIEWRQSR
ncbi:MAG: hypothetical protein DLM61_06325 [Pseudonocardiales bacterium]|nr:MAG: hypothetical protein DLM61_06325 [Pseudonocardiales bacterium]